MNVWRKPRMFSFKWKDICGRNIKLSIDVEIHFWNVNFYRYICGRQWNNHVIHFSKSPCLNHSLLKWHAKCKLSTTTNKRNIILLELVKNAQRSTFIVKRTIVHANCKFSFFYFYAQDCVSYCTEGKQWTGNNTCSSVDYSASMKIINCSLRV